METHLIHSLRAAFVFLFFPGMVISEENVYDAGIGFALSSSGQSIFYAHTFQPLSVSHYFASGGIHIEEEGLSLPYYDQYGNVYRNTGNQTAFIEIGFGWRHLLFDDQIDGTFKPHATLEIGGSGHLARTGNLKTFMDRTVILWAPYTQISIGFSAQLGRALNRVDIGYLSTLDELSPRRFSQYHGVFLKFLYSWGLKAKK